MNSETSTKRYGMVIDAASCVNCKACVIACKAENAVADGYSRNWVRETENGAFPAVTLTMDPGACMHCTEPPCVPVCPTDATFVDDWNMVAMNPDECIACEECIDACPYDARYLDEGKDVVDKCSFCRHRVEQGVDPSCVTTCPTSVRVFGDLNDQRSAVAKLAARATTRVLKPEAGTGPNLLYLDE